LISQDMNPTKKAGKPATMPGGTIRRHRNCQRLGAVLQVIYLVFNEGYSAAAGAEVTRAELTGEAIRLGRLLTELRPEPEVIGLLS
jgi:predicted RNA polymerase sigma factor